MITVALVVNGLLISLSANPAVFTGLGDQAVYDTDLDITRQADVNHAQTSEVGTNDRMFRNTAQARAGSLNTANPLGFNDWRLPITPQLDPACSGKTGDVSPRPFGSNCADGELGYSSDAEGITVAVPNPFSNFESDREYLSDTEYAPEREASTDVWNSFFLNGRHNEFSQTIDMRGWAVDDGDIVVSAVLVAAVWLFGSGLGLLGWMRRKAV